MLKFRIRGLPDRLGPQPRGNFPAPGARLRRSFVQWAGTPDLTRPSRAVSSAVVTDEFDDGYRTAICEGRDAAQDAYDKSILTVAGGALAVALGFVKTGGPPDSKWLLAVACALFAISLLSIIYSFKASRHSFDAQLAALDNRVDSEAVRRMRPGGKHSGLTEFLNTTAFVCLVFGIAALATFVIGNLGR